jgi:broad specificity phosphatase PhoE
LPDVEGAEYLVSLLNEAGLVSQTGMGVAPLEWPHIESWLNVTELSLTVWEKLTIKNMSEAYAGEYNQASDPNRPAPYVHVDEEMKVDREAVENRLLSALRSLGK